MKKTILPLIGLSLLFASCSEKEEATNQDVSKGGPLAEVVLQTAPDKPVDIATMRTSAQAGETVTFTGKIMGSDTVFMDGRAVMILGDPKKMTPCNEIPGDECPAPWDVCCDDPDVVTASIVTVQVVDESGKPVKASLKGVSGLTELSSVTVTGEVAASSNKENMLVNATGIYVHPSKK